MVQKKLSQNRHFLLILAESSKYLRYPRCFQHNYLKLSILMFILLSL